MLKISNVNVYDLDRTLVASGNAMRTEPAEYTSEEIAKGLQRMIKLCKSKTNSGHCNALCGIRVSFDITYPQYISPELQRYHWFDIVTSSSKMHRLCKMEIRKCCNKYVNEVSYKNMENLVSIYNNDPTYENFMVMLSNTVSGLELFMRVSTNYLQLRTMWGQRKNHKLKEDWGALCSMIETLPYAKELITIK